MKPLPFIVGFLALLGAAMPTEAPAQVIVSFEGFSRIGPNAPEASAFAIRSDPGGVAPTGLRSIRSAAASARSAAPVSPPLPPPPGRTLAADLWSASRHPASIAGTASRGPPALNDAFSLSAAPDAAPPAHVTVLRLLVDPPADTDDPAAFNGAGLTPLPARRNEK